MEREWGDNPEQDRADAELNDIHGWWCLIVLVGMGIKTWDWWPGIVLGLVAYLSTLALTFVTYFWRMRHDG